MKTFRLSFLFLATMIAVLIAFVCPTPAASQEPTEGEPQTAEQEEEKESKALKAIAASKAVYVGVSKCKSCHNKESAGEIYDKWELMSHSKAFEVLKSDEAKAVAKDRGIEDPTKAAECMKCHDTAYSEPKERKHRRFKGELGVQCETCHGPGSEHVKARLAFAKENKPKEGVLLEVPVNEMVLPDKLLCQSCHNDESPSYKEFKFGERLKEIRHLHPQREKPRVVPPKKKKDEETEG